VPDWSQSALAALFDRSASLAARPRTVRALPGGLTNRNYQVSVPDGTFVARISDGGGDLLAIDREQRRAVTRQAFGFALPSLTMFDRGEKSDEADRLTETLATAWQTPDGKWMFRLRNGAVWRQIDDYTLGRDPHPGSAIVIRRAMLGSYILNVDGQPALKVHRDS
jgi:hypothetical protein